MWQAAAKREAGSNQARHQQLPNNNDRFGQCLLQSRVITKPDLDPGLLEMIPYHNLLLNERNNLILLQEQELPLLNLKLLAQRLNLILHRISHSVPLKFPLHLVVQCLGTGAIIELLAQCKLYKVLIISIGEMEIFRLGNAFMPASIVKRILVNYAAKHQ